MKEDSQRVLKAREEEEEGCARRTILLGGRRCCVRVASALGVDAVQLDSLLRQRVPDARDQVLAAARRGEVGSESAEGRNARTVREDRECSAHMQT